MGLYAGFFVTIFRLEETSTRLAEDASLLDAGVIDSTGVLELVDFIERRFGLNVPDGDLLPENFESIANITRYVLNRLGSFHEHHL